MTSSTSPNGVRRIHTRNASFTICCLIFRVVNSLQVQLNLNALPLALLLAHPGGAARVRGFVARALEVWLRERTRARLTQALAR